MIASNFPCTSRFSHRQSAWIVLRIRCRSVAFWKAFASMAALPSTLVTSKPASASWIEWKPVPVATSRTFIIAARLELLDEEAALALRAICPVDQLVPLLDEGLDVLGLVVIGLANGGRRVSEVLADRAQ
jgi:hypothetical protein